MPHEERRTTRTRPRVLLADDYTPLMVALTRLLSPDCDIVGQARTAAELVKAATTFGPDVVVVDLHLADTNGVEACRQLRAVQPGVKIIIVTADDNAHIRSAAWDAGASDFVPKCLAHTQLLPAILRLWSGSGSAEPH